MPSPSPPAKSEGEELARFLLRNRQAIGPAWQEYLWLKFPPDPLRVSINRAAAHLNKDRRTVARNFQRLKESGIVAWEAVPGRPHRYRVLL